MTETKTTALSPGQRRTLARSAAITTVFIVPAMLARFTHIHLDPVVTMLIYGAAVVAASFLLAWAAEAAQIDVSGGLAIAVLALIAVLPEYAVDLYYAFRAGSVPEYTQYAAANMTGSNRLLMGLGWPLVVMIGLAASRKLTGERPTVLPLASSNRVELGFLLIAGAAAFIIPVTAEIHLALAIVLLAWFGYYLFKLSRGEVEEPDLIGTAAAIGAFGTRTRRRTVIGLFVLAAGVILLCAEPFAESMIDVGTQLGIDQFLLVQWLAPLASEAPEFIIAIIFAARGKPTAAIATLISSKVNQWTLLIGSLPLAYLAGGGGIALHLDTRQVEETLITAAQTLMGVAMILSLRFHRVTSWLLLGLFVIQFPITSTHGRLILSAVYGVLAIAELIINRRQIAPTLRAPFL